ncbi:hypothetical protein HOY80DRAFT_230792 [Tuber brumale]|nr:hypothetical protein HOY80DRAFT_230792 [Tuber brumale]
MRLRLFIQRNRLPPTKIWWDTSSFEPGDDHNVSTLLSRVGQIVPMESGGCGLEDYAVEVDGFEVLHFQEVERVIREGDQVVIRPLTTTEIRQRRASGRRQISTSGRKLLDGTPFGRPMVTTRPAPDRPRLSIPPRKRAKTGCGVDCSTLVQVGSDHEGESGEDESNDESCKECEEQGVSEMVDDDDDGKAVGDNTVAEVEACAELDGSEESDDEEQDDIDGADFEELSRDYENPLMDYFDYDEVASSQISFSDQPSQLKVICGSRDTQSLQGKDGSLKGDSSEDDIYTDSESSQYQDSDLSDAGDSSEKIVHGNEDSMDVGIVSRAGDLFLPDYFHSDASAAGGAVDSPKLPQFYQSAEMSEVGEDERERELEHPYLTESLVSPGPELNEDSRSSSENSYCSSDSEESGESENRGLLKDKGRSKKASPNKAPSTSQVPPPSRVTSVIIEQPKKLAVASGPLPHQRNPGTKARNERKKQRRNNERLLAELVNTGFLPKDSTINDLKKHRDNPHKNADEQMRHSNEHPLVEGTGEKQTSFELSEERVAEEPTQDVVDHTLKKTQKTQQSNDSLCQGVKSKNWRRRVRRAFIKAKKRESIPANWDFNRWLMEREKKVAVEGQPNNIDVEEDADGDVSMVSIGEPVELGSNITSKQTGISLSHDRCPPPPPHQDPLTSAQERGRPQGPCKIIYDKDGAPNPVYAGFDEQQYGVEDPEAWRDKIVLSAVECEQEGVEIPTPEFPFKQPTYQPSFGWDTIGNNKRKRNSGTKKRKQGQQRKNCSSNYGYRGYQDPGYGDWDGHNDYDDRTVAPTSAEGKSTDVAQVDLVDDLPPLPENVASLYPLTKPVLPGTIVAFKQLMLTEDYTPIMADYRTAIVQAVHAQEKDGPALELRLAIRDRPKRRIDPETGEKILRKFEMPGNENEDEGLLGLMFEQLLEAKVVKLPESAGLDQSVNGDEGGGIGEGAGTQEGSPGGQRNGGTVNHDMPEVADSYPHNIHVNATLSDGLVPPSAEGSQDQEQDLELELGLETQAAQPQESLKSPSPVDGILGTAVSLSSAPTSQAGASVPPAVDNEDSDPSYEPDSVSDSDGLETLESMFASSQRIKPEPSSQRSPVLPPLPVFSPSGSGVGEDDEQS